MPAFNGIFTKAKQAASLAGKIQETQIAIKKTQRPNINLKEKLPR